MNQLKGLKRKKTMILVILAVIAVLAGIVVAVRPSARTNPELKEAGFTALKNGSKAITKDENRKQKLIVAVDLIDGCLNPAFATASADRMACELIYEPLAEVNLDGTYDPVLAESVEWNQETLTMTVKLKPGIQFSDGTPVTADDVCASIGLNCLAEYNLDTEGPYFHIKGVWDRNEQKTQGISGIRKKDDNTVELEFMDGYSQNWDILETKIQKNRFATIDGQLSGFGDVAGYYNSGVGTGPYMEESMVLGLNLILKANPNYRGTVNDIKQVEFSQTNFYDVKEAVENQMIDVVFYTATSEQFDTMYGGKQFDVYARPTDSIYGLGFNTTNIFLKDENVRRAIAYAFNKENALNKDWKMKIAPTDVIGYGVAGVCDQFQSAVITYDKSKAESIIKEAALEGRIELRFPVLKENEFQMHMASCIKKDLEAVGIEVKIKECTSEEYVQALYVEDKFDLYLFNSTMNYDWNTFETITMPRDGMPVAFLDNDYVELVNRVRSAMNREEYLTSLTELSNKFYEKVPVIPFGRVQRYLSVSADLSGYGASPESNMLEQVNEIRSSAK